MKINEQIAQQLLDVNEGANWTEVNVKDTLEGISYKEANAITLASSNSIAGLQRLAATVNRNFSFVFGSLRLAL